MHYTSHILSSDSIQSAENYFPEDYIECVRKKHTYEQSLVARYEISQIVEKYWHIANFLPRVDSEGKPIFEWWIFWSISHSWNHVLIWVSSEPIGVDIEIIQPRDIALFGTFSDKEWLLIWEKDWTSFYVLWSAKEALVKKYRGGVDDIVKWKLIRIEIVSEMTQKLYFSDGARTEVVNSEIMDGVVRSVCGDRE